MCRRRGTGLTFKQRRDEEDELSATRYADLPYPENQLVALAHSLLKRGLIDESELRQRLYRHSGPVGSLSLEVVNACASTNPEFVTVTYWAGRAGRGKGCMGRPAAEACDEGQQCPHDSVTAAWRAMGYGRVPLNAGHAQVLTARIGRHRQRPFPGRSSPTTGATASVRVRRRTVLR